MNYFATVFYTFMFFHYFSSSSGCITHLRHLWQGLYDKEFSGFATERTDRRQGRRGEGKEEASEKRNHAFGKSPVCREMGVEMLTEERKK